MTTTTTMTTIPTNPTYVRARARGYRAVDAYRLAQTERAFAARTDVRLRVEPEREDYFDVCGEPVAYNGPNGARISAAEAHDNLVDTLARLGCWVVDVERRCPVCGNWEHIDSIGMVIAADPLDPFDNPHIVDLMGAALDDARETAGID